MAPRVVIAVLLVIRAAVLTDQHLHLAPELRPTSTVQVLLLRITEQLQHMVHHHNAKVTPLSFNIPWCLLLALQLGACVTHCVGRVTSAPSKKSERSIQGTLFKLGSLELLLKLLNHESDF